MKAYRFPNGKVLVPKAIYEDGIVADGWVMVEADSPEAKSYASHMVDAPQKMVEAWKKLREDAGEAEAR